MVGVTSYLEFRRPTSSQVTEADAFLCITLFVILVTLREIPIFLTADVAAGRRYQTRKPLLNVKQVDFRQLMIGAAMKPSDLSQTPGLINHR